MQRGGEVRELEDEAVALQTGWNAVAAVEGEFGIGFQDERRAETDHPFSGGKSDRNSQNFSERAHEFGVGNRIRRGGDVGAGHVFIDDALEKKLVHVGFVNPADSLTAVSDFSSQSPARQLHQAAERAAVSSQHETGPENDAALFREFGLFVSFLPGFRDERSQAVSESGIFIANGFGRIAVAVGGGHLNPNRRRAVDGADRFSESERGFYAGTENFVAVVGSFDAVDGPADEVDQGGRAVEFFCPIAEVSSVPVDLTRRVGGLGRFAGEDRDIAPELD